LRRMNISSTRQGSLDEVLDKRAALAALANANKIVSAAGESSTSDERLRIIYIYIKRRARASVSAVSRVGRCATELPRQPCAAVHHGSQRGHAICTASSGACADADAGLAAPCTTLGRSRHAATPLTASVTGLCSRRVTTGARSPRRQR
jgi:hypothetical protein